MLFRKLLFIGLFIAALTAATSAQSGYQKPPQQIQSILDAPPLPQTLISPTRDMMLVAEPKVYPSIEELAQPMLRLAGIRINPQTNAQHRQPYYTKLTLRNVLDGKEAEVTIPGNAKIISPQWSADGRYIAAGNLTDKGVELWVIDSPSGRARQIRGVRINTAFGGFQWMPDQKTILMNAVVEKRGAAPTETNNVPGQPIIQETAGKTGAVQTFQDLLKSPLDEKLFEYYAASQMMIATLDFKMSAIGTSGIYESVEPSPDGSYFLVTKLKRPFSYLYPYQRFPREIEIWDKNGKVIKQIADIPLQDNIVADGVPTGMRAIAWIPTEAATLSWVEALDGGNPRTKAAFRDRILMQPAPFAVAPTEIAKLEDRYAGRVFGERDNLLIYSELNRDTRVRRQFALNFKGLLSKPRLLNEQNVNERYNDFGTILTKRLPNGFTAARQYGSDIFLTGAGATAEGDRPFLRRFNIQTLESQELFRSRADKYESFVAVMNEEGTSVLKRRESKTEVPNLYIDDRKITDFQDPTPQLRGITTKLVKYKRADGVDLSFTLYLPPNYREGTPLPTVVWAYPLEFTDAGTAGQVSGSPNRFVNIGGYSHLFFAMMGYAVLDNATMPVIGKPETVNDTFIKQIVDSAQAAVNKAVEMGVTDRNRVGVGGHSYGAFMTANLLAHSDIFRAGIARSGAYNRTLTPFGFQSERRNFWEARELYENVSPFFYANQIKEPILFIHGEADNNQGTFPIQSERMFAAIQGTGGTARLVMLPLESHGYSAKESVEHTLFEMFSWFDRYVKNTPRK